MRAPSPPARQVPSSSIQKPWSHVRGDGRFVALRLVVEDRRHRDLAGDGGGRRRRLIEKVAMDLALLVLFDVTRRRDPELEARDSGEGLLQPFEVRPRERQREGADVVVDDERDVVRLAGAFALRHDGHFHSLRWTGRKRCSKRSVSWRASGPPFAIAKRT